jgi:hypothetical protein
MEEEKTEYKPEPPKPLKETAILRKSIDTLKDNINFVLGQLDTLKEQVDKMEEHFKEVLANPAPPAEKSEIDTALDDLLNS